MWVTCRQALAALSRAWGPAKPLEEDELEAGMRRPQEEEARGGEGCGSGLCSCCFLSPPSPPTPGREEASRVQADQGGQVSRTSSPTQHGSMKRVLAGVVLWRVDIARGLFVLDQELAATRSRQSALASGQAQASNSQVLDQLESEVVLEVGLEALQARLAFLQESSQALAKLEKDIREGQVPLKEAMVTKYKIVAALMARVRAQGWQLGAATADQVAVPGPLESPDGPLKKLALQLVGALKEKAPPRPFTPSPSQPRLRRAAYAAVKPRAAHTLGRDSIDSGGDEAAGSDSEEGSGSSSSVGNGGGAPSQSSKVASPLERRGSTAVRLLQFDSPASDAIGAGASSDASAGSGTGSTLGEEQGVKGEDELPEPAAEQPGSMCVPEPAPVPGILGREGDQGSSSIATPGTSLEALPQQQQVPSKASPLQHEEVELQTPLAASQGLGQAGDLAAVAAAAAQSLSLSLGVGSISAAGSDDICSGDEQQTEEEEGEPASPNGTSQAGVQELEEVVKEGPEKTGELGNPHVPTGVKSVQGQLPTGVQEGVEGQLPAQAPSAPAAAVERLLEGIPQEQLPVPAPPVAFEVPAAANLEQRARGLPSGDEAEESAHLLNPPLAAQPPTPRRAPQTNFRSRARPAPGDSIKRLPRVPALYYELRSGASASCIAWSMSLPKHAASMERSGSWRKATAEDPPGPPAPLEAGAAAALSELASNVAAFSAATMLEVSEFVSAKRAVLEAAGASEAAESQAVAGWPTARWQALAQAAEVFERLANMCLELAAWTVPPRADTMAEARRLCAYVAEVSEVLTSVAFPTTTLRATLEAHGLPWDPSIVENVRWAAQGAAEAVMERGMEEAKERARAPRSTAASVVPPLANAVVAAFKVHQLCGGLSSEATSVFDVLHAATIQYTRMVDPHWFRDRKIA